MQATLAAPHHPPAARGLKRPPHADPALHLLCHGWTSFSNHLGAGEVETMRREIESAFASPALQPEILSPYGCGGILLDLLRLPAIASLLFTRETMERLAEAVGPGFVLLPEPITPASGLLTPTGKTRRRLVEQRYGKVIDALYSGAKEARLTKAAGGALTIHDAAVTAVSNRRSRDYASTSCPVRSSGTA